MAVEQVVTEVLMRARDQLSPAMGQAASATQQMERRADTANRSLLNLGKAGDVAKAALAGMAIATGGAVLAAVGFAKAAAEEQEGIARLAQAVRNAGGDWDALGSTIEGQIAKWEKLSAFSDGEMRDALAMLVAQTGSVEEAMKRLPVAMDLAQGSGTKLGEASKLLGKVTDENTGALKRLGIAVQEGATATDLLAATQQKFGGQSEAFAKTAAGQWKIFQKSLDNLKEDIGAELLPMFTELGRTATNALAWLRESGVMDTFAKALKTVTGVLGELFGVITGSAPDAGAMLKGVVGPDVANAVMQGLALIRDTFRSIVGGDLTAVVSGFRARVPVIFESVMRFIGDAVPKIAERLLDWGKEFIAFAARAVPPLLEELMRLLSAALAWIGDHSEDIGRTLVQWGLKFGEFILTTAIPAVIQNLPGILLKIGAWVATEAIPGVLRVFAGIGKGIAEGIWSGIQQMWTWLTDRIRDAIAQLPAFVREFLGIRSPSTVFAEIGEEIPRGLAAGIMSTADVAVDAVRTVGSRLAATMQQSVALAQQSLAAVHPNALHTLTGGITFATAGQVVDASQMRLGDAIVGRDGTIVYKTPGLQTVTMGSIPSFAEGGVMPRDGLAYLHANETVLPPGVGEGLTINVGTFIGRGGPADARDFARFVHRELSALQFRRYRQLGGRHA